MGGKGELNTFIGLRPYYWQEFPLLIEYRGTPATAVAVMSLLGTANGSIYNIRIIKIKD